MPRDGSFTYSLPNPNLTSGEDISAAEHNETRQDMASAHNDVAIIKDHGALQDINMQNYKIEDLADGTDDGDAVNLQQLNDAISGIGMNVRWCGTTSGTTALTVTPSTALTTHTGAMLIFQMGSNAGDGSTAYTINPSGLGAKALRTKRNGTLGELGNNQLLSGQIALAQYDGTQYVIVTDQEGQAADNATDAGTYDLTGINGNYVALTTGTTTITAFTVPQGRMIIIRFDTARTLTYNATTLEIPTNANVTTIAGDHALLFGKPTSGQTRILAYWRDDGTPLALNSTLISANASNILTAIKTVDGSGSGLDADTLDGVESTSFSQVDQNTSATAVTYNIGTTIAVDFSTPPDVPDLNEVTSIYRANSSPKKFQITTSSATILTGTWRSRGSVLIESGETSSSYVGLYQRTA